MKKILLFAFVVLLVCSLVVPAFAAAAPTVRYGLYDDYFIFEGVSYSLTFYETDMIPSFMYLNGNELLIVYRSLTASPFVTVAGDGKLTYYDASSPVRLIFTVSNNIPSYSWASISKRTDATTNDLDVFRSNVLVSRDEIYCAKEYNNGALFRGIQQEFFFDLPDPEPDPEPDPDLPVYDADILGFFSGLFGGLALIFETTPMLYLFGILILAFVILGIKMIYRH